MDDDYHAQQDYISELYADEKRALQLQAVADMAYEQECDAWDAAHFVGPVWDYEDWLETQVSAKCPF